MAHAVVVGLEQGVARMVPMVSVIDGTAERSLTKTVLSLGDRPSRQCVLPRASATRASKGTLYVACLSSVAPSPAGGPLTPCTYVSSASRASPWRRRA